MSETKNKDATRLVFYDAECGVCATWARRFRRSFERRGFGVVPLQTPGAAERLQVEEADLRKEMKVLTREGAVLGGADAILYLARNIFWAWPIYALGCLPGVKHVLRQAYRFFASHRMCTTTVCRRAAVRTDTANSDRRLAGKIHPAIRSGLRMKTGRIVIAGGSGFLGRLLARRFVESGCEVVLLTRSSSGSDGNGIRRVHWDGRSTGPWTSELEGALAVINLAGRSVNCRYDAVRRREILESRLGPTRALAAAITDCRRPPQVWLNSSTATIYRHSMDRPMDEASGEIASTPEAKDKFSIEVALAWEAAVNDACAPATRRVILRTAMVLAPVPGTVFATLRRLVRWGLGGRMASGRQFVSWIHDEDFCRAIEWLIERDDLGGAINVAAPHPVTNAGTMKILRDVCGVPFGLPAPQWLLEVGAFFLRTETELIVKSRQVVPRRLAESGFRFLYPDLEPAARDIERRWMAR